MSAPPNPPDYAAIQAAQTERFRVILNHVVDVCVEVVDGLHVQAKAGPATAVTIPLEHIVRTLRRTMALAQKYAEPPKPHAKIAERQRSRIFRDVSDAIQRRAETDREARGLRNELRERIDSPDMLDDIADLPVEKIVIDLLRDLGLAHIPGTHPWARRTPKDIAALKLWAAGTGSDPPLVVRP